MNLVLDERSEQEEKESSHGSGCSCWINKERTCSIQLTSSEELPVSH